MNVLVIGGAGYIGSHCVRQLAATGHRPVVLDNFVYGHRGALPPEVAVHEGDLGDEALVRRVLHAEKIDLVMHFAAFCDVGESVHDPLKYYLNNSAAPMHLLRAMLDVGVKKFVFSSTCATSAFPPRCRSTRTCRRRRSTPMARPSSTWRLRCAPSHRRPAQASPLFAISMRPAPPRTAPSAKITNPRPT